MYIFIYGLWPKIKVVLSLYYLQSTAAELDLVGTLYTTWDELVLKSKNIDASLISVKKKFTEVCRHRTEQNSLF